jgi:hypothetical protein
VNEATEGSTRKGRRRRTLRHRRNRLARRTLYVAAIALITGACTALVLKGLAPSLFEAQNFSPPSFEQAELSRERLLTLDQLIFQGAAPPDRPVYPYSIVPGGVQDVKELKWVAEHDPVVAAHYAGFDYDHARVVRLTLARSAYVSYRIGKHVYWTHRRLTLHKGEKVITDGKMMARTRCANSVEEVPQQAAEPGPEPPAEKFDQPGPPANATTVRTPPVPFESALLNRPRPLGPLPTGPMSLFNPLPGQGWLPLSPPPVPAGLCEPNKKTGEVEKGCCVGGEVHKKKKGAGCGAGGTGVVPEPSTWILFTSGLAVIFWQSRRKLIRAKAF